MNLRELGTRLLKQGLIWIFFRDRIDNLGKEDHITFHIKSYIKSYLEFTEYRYKFIACLLCHLSMGLSNRQNIKAAENIQ